VEYFPLDQPVGQPVRVERRPTVEVAWGSQPPVAELGGHPWSAAFHRRVRFATAGPALQVDAVGGVRILVGDQVVFDAWAQATYSGPLAVPAPVGEYDIEVQYRSPRNRGSPRLRVTVPDAGPVIGTPTPSPTAADPRATPPTATDTPPKTHALWLPLAARG
jgi:hypothetical protein